MKKDIYHVLRGSLGQCILIPQVVDLDILDVVSIGDVYFSIHIVCAGIRGGGAW